MALPLTESDVAWLKSYAADVLAVYGAVFDESKPRFTKGRRLLDRFETSIDSVLANGRGNFRAVDEAHNEICIAAAIVANADLGCVSLAYEPALPNSAKTIDFRAECSDGSVLFVDVKTIKPVPTDRWDQYKRAIEEGWLPKHIEIDLEKEALGGELWHSMFASRSRMLEYTLELEQKIAEADMQNSKALFLLAFCGEGFHWNEDELEDFVSFYRFGKHRSDDPFGLAETKHMEEKGVAMSGAVSCFACMRRSQGDIRAKRLNWNVKAPITPALL